VKKKFLFILKSFLLKRTKVTIVTSTGRTGTKFIKTFFSTVFPNLIVKHEPFPDFFDLGVEKIRHKKDSNYLKKYLIEHRGSLLLSSKNLFRILVGKEIKYIECNPFLFPLINEYAQVFKEFNMVYITRNPETYICSALRKEPKNNGENNFYGENDTRQRLNAVDYGESNLKEWKSLSRGEKIAWYWRKCNYILLEKQSILGDNAVQVKFEDLFNDNLNVQIENWHKIVKVIGVSPDRINEKNLRNIKGEKVNASKDVPIRSEDFNDEIKQRIDDSTMAMKKRLSY